MGNRALAYAVKLLTRREYAREELIHKLTGRGFSSTEVVRVLQLLIDKGWQSDSRFISEYVRMRVAKGFGPLRISAELKAKGIDPQLVAETFQADIIDWVDLASRVLDKKNRCSPGELTKKQQFEFLLYRGFAVEQINKIFKYEKN